MSDLTPFRQFMFMQLAQENNKTQGMRQELYLQHNRGSLVTRHFVVFFAQLDRYSVSRNLPQASVY